MCNACNDSFKFPMKFTKRSKLGDVSSTYHCSIVGTCLSFREMERIAHRARMVFPEGASDYQKHGAFVHNISQRPSLAKSTQKFLDKKFSSIIRKTNKITCADQLLDFWQHASDAGDIPGPYWACLTHSLADAKLSGHFFGNVHMLSHLVGASNRADIKLLAELETDLDRHKDTHVKSRKHMRSILQCKNETIRLQQVDLAIAERQKSETLELRDQLTRLENGEDKKFRAEQFVKLENQLVITTRENADLTEKLRTTLDVLKENENLTLKLADLQKEHEVLETLAHRKFRSLSQQCATKTPLPPEESIDLDGATIVYVGGRTGNIPNFRSLVEEANGVFVHHDGGKEDSDQRLVQVLSGGDIVMCPMDCVSHQASLTAKKFCKHAGKTFVPLRSSGLSSFASNLQGYSQKQEHLS